MPRNYSSTQFGGSSDDSVFAPAPEMPSAPLSLGQSTSSSFARRTAWTTASPGQSAPLSYSKRTRGTVMSFDDDTSSAVPKSDRGAGRND